jgi:hypothetical protein
MRQFSGALLRTLQYGSIVVATGALVACGGGDSGSSPGATLSGTAAVGAALANASVTLTCKNGTGSATANANGAYSATFSFDGPCAITATNGTITINSVAAGGGTYNVTPLTQLLLSYLAGSLGTTVSGVLSGVTSSTTIQGALASSTVLANSQTAVAKLIQSMYGITLSSSSFLTVSFTPGQAGADSDLDTLLAAGAITSDGQPSAALVAAAYAAGAAAPISSGSNGASGGTGGSTGSGTVTQ